MYLFWHKNYVSKNTSGLTGEFYCEFYEVWTSFWNETHSRMKSFLTSFKSTEPKKTTWRQDWSLDQPFQNLTCHYTTQLPLFHRHPTQSIISQSISESLSVLQGYTVWLDCNLVQIIQLQMPPYIRLNSKHLYKIWSERGAELMCKNVLKWMVSNFISPMLRLLPSFEGRGGCSHAA